MKTVFLSVLLILAACTVTPQVKPPGRSRLAAALGKKLFFDDRLSKGNKMSCATCHQPARAFTNGERAARGVHGSFGERNVPTLINRANGTIQFWDGRAASLEDQVTMVITSDIEMGSDIQEVLTKLREDDKYPGLFREVFNEDGIEPRKIASAIAAYERTLHSGEAPYDRYVAGDTQALSAAQLRGMNLFFKEFKCAACHTGSNFSDEALRPNCYPATNNLSQFQPIVPEKSKWIKTPTLRNLKYTAPYLHNGSLQTLEQVVDFYTPSFQATGPDREPDTKAPVTRIDRKQKKDLVAFLNALSAEKPFIEVND